MQILSSTTRLATICNLRSITELRDEGERKGDHNMAALWDWLARQVADVRDTDARELQVSGRDFSTPAEGEN